MKKLARQFKDEGLIENKKGFTLSEVLITLAIIGVVAAMTLNTLNKKINDIITVNKLKDTYAIMTQAMKLAQNEYGDLEYWGLNGKFNSTHDLDIFSSHLNPFLKIAVDCKYSNNKKCTINQPYKIYKNGPLNTANYATCTNPYYYKLILLNGASLIYRTYDSGEKNQMQVFIDVNGVKPPNAWGQDLFGLKYYPPDKNFIYAGDPRTNSSYKDKCPYTSASACTYYVAKVGHTVNYPKSFK